LNNKLLTLILALSFVSAALAGCTSNEDDDDDGDTTVESTTVKIGFLNPLTGPLAQDAAGFTYGATEAITDLNAMQTDVTFELVEVDSGCDGTAAAAAAQTLVDSKVVGAAGAACSGASMAANAVLSAAGIPMISYASTNPGLSNATAYPNFFRVVPSDALQGPAAAAMMVYDEVEELAILHMTNDYGAGLADSIEAAWGSELCAKVGYSETTTDISAEITQIADAGCDAIFMVSYVTDAALILNEVAAQELDVWLYSGDGPAGVGLLEELSDPSVADFLMVTAPRAGSTYGDFEARYDASGVGSIKQYVLTSYDAVTMIGKAYVADSSDMTASIKTVGTAYEGASGLHTFDANGDVSGAGYDVCMYYDDEYECVGYWTVENGITENEMEVTTFKIGFMNPLTGPLAQDAAGFTYGAEEAIEDLNDEYAEWGYAFELVEVDSGCDGTAAAAAAQTLVDSGVIAAGGAACSGASMAANAVLSAAGIPMISYASTNPGLSDASAYPDFFRIVPSDALQGPAAADMMAYAEAESPAILHMTNDYGGGLADSIEEAWGTEDVCAKIGYSETQTDFSSEITQIESAGCDAVFMVSYVTDAALILEAIAGSSLDVMLFSGDGPAGEGLLEELSDDTAADGLHVTAPRAGASYGDFEDRYDNSGVGSIKQYVLTSYDSISMIGHAAVFHDLDMCEDDTMTTCIFEVGVDYDGASGLHTFLENGDVAGSGYDICGYYADGSDDGEYECVAFWTLDDGIEEVVEEITIKLGFMNPLTGPLAQDAAGFTYGAEEAINDLNEMYADWGYTFELVEVDSGCDGTTAAAAAQTLVDSGVWATGGAACSGASMAANAVLSAAGVPMISYASTNPSLSDASAYPDFFRIVPSDALQGPAAADMMASMNVTSPAILHMTNDYGSGFADAIEEAWGSENVCQKIGYAETQTDFSSEITQIESAGCDAIFMVSYVTDAALILEAIAGSSLDVMLFSGDGPAGEGLLAELSDDTAADGLYVTAPRAGVSFGDFEERYDGSGVGSIKQYVLTSYDSIMILGHAAVGWTEDSCDTESDCIFEVGTDYEGASGLHTFLENGDVGGAGYDICGYTADAEDNGAYECMQYWTIADGVQSE